MDVDDDDAFGRLESDVKAFGSFFRESLVAWIAKRRLNEEGQRGERHETEHDRDYISIPSPRIDIATRSLFR